MPKKLFAAILFLLLTLTACTTNYSPITMNEVEKELGIKFDFPLVWLYSAYDYWQEKTVRVKFSTDEEGLNKLLAKFDPKLNSNKIPYQEREQRGLNDEEWKPNDDRPLKAVRFDPDRVVKNRKLMFVDIFFKQQADKAINVYILYMLD